MHNEFDAKAEILFITYDEIIKSPYPYLLNKIDTELSPYYESFIDVEKFKGLDMNNLLRFCTQRTDKHLFRYLSKVDFDVDGALKELKDRYYEVYKDSPLLSMGDSIKMLLTQKFTEKIYIYTDIYDIRVHLDIQTMFGDMQRVNYVSGNIQKVLNKLEGITTFVINDLDYLFDIVESGKTEYVNIMLASYAYNYIYNEDTKELELRVDVESMLKDKICKFATFIPAEFKREHFSQLKE